MRSKNAQWLNSLDVVLVFSTGTRSPQRRGFSACSVLNSSWVSEVPKVLRAGTEDNRQGYPTRDQVFRRGARRKNSLGRLLLFDDSASKGSRRLLGHAIEKHSGCGFASAAATTRSSLSSARSTASRSTITTARSVWGQNWAVSHSQIREHRKPTEFTKQ